MFYLIFTVTAKLKVVATGLEQLTWSLLINTGVTGALGANLNTQKELLPSCNHQQP